MDETQIVESRNYVRSTTANNNIHAVTFFMWVVFTRTMMLCDPHGWDDAGANLEGRVTSVLGIYPGF